MTKTKKIDEQANLIEIREKINELVAKSNEMCFPSDLIEKIANQRNRLATLEAMVKYRDKRIKTLERQIIDLLTKSCKWIKEDAPVTNPADGNGNVEDYLKVVANKIFTESHPIPEDIAEYINEHFDEFLS